LIRVRAALTWLALLWAAVVFVGWPQTRLSGRAYLGGCWIVVCWFLLARTKSLSWSAYLRFFALCLPWSGLIGWVTLRLSQQPYVWSGVVFTVGAEADGALIAIAGIGEECLKLAPLAVLALLAPGRVARLAAVDWTLLGVASGGAFLIVEETVRRLTLGADRFGAVHLSLSLEADGLPTGWTRYGWWPLGSELEIAPTDFAGTPLGDPVAWYAGHLVATALLATGIGLAVAWWRRSGWMGRIAALIVPGLTLWLIAADHAMYNSNTTGLLCGPTRSIGGQTPPPSLVPWWLRWPWQACGHGQGRHIVFLLAAGAALLVDAGRLITRPSTLTGQEHPVWADRPINAVLARHGLTRDNDTFKTSGSNGFIRGLVRLAAAGLRMVAAVVDRLAALAWIAARDWRDALAGFARQSEEPRRAALARGLTVLSAQRADRELSYQETSGPVRPGRARLVAGTGLAVLLAAALLLAPRTANAIGLYGCDWFWLAGILQDLADWWANLPVSSKLALVIGVLSLIALPWCSGGIGLYLLTAYGVADWGWQHRQALDTLRRSPRQAWKDLSNLSPTELVLETLGFVLTFLPAGVLGRRAVPVVRSAAREIRADPVAVRRHLPDILRSRASTWSFERWVAGRQLDPIGKPAQSKLVEIVDHRNAVIGEIDRIDLRTATFIEDKSARGLSNINPRIQGPLDAAQQWANRQIYKKTKKRIESLFEASSTRVTTKGSLVIPRLDQIQGIKKFTFQIEANTTELRQAVYDVLRRLRLEHPGFSFDATFRVIKK
jgi:hypothetical protein